MDSIFKDFRDLCEHRYSVRAYFSKEVEKEKLDYILRCAQLAPSAVNFQPWILYVVTDENVKRDIQKAYDREWFTTAPLYIVICKDTSQSWKRSNYDNKDFGDVDAAIVSTHICIAAHEQGLGCCWVCNFDPVILREALKLEDKNIEPVVIFPIGYIDKVHSKVPLKKRKEINNIVRNF